MGYYGGWYCNTDGIYDFQVSKNHKVWTTFSINSNPQESQKYISKVSLSNGYNLDSNSLEKCYVCIFDQEFSGTSFNENNTYDGLISFTFMNISYNSGYIYDFLIDNLRLYDSEKTYYLYYLADENEDEDNKLMFKSGEFYDYFIPNLTLEKSDYYIITFKSEENEITDIYFGPGNYTIPTISVSKTGHELIGWKTNEPNSSLVKAGDSIQPSSNLTYIAEWIPATFIITFDANGGEFKPNSFINGSNTPELKPCYGTQDYCEWGALAEASRPGYTLTGYFDSKTGGNPIYYKTGECEYGSPYWDTFGQWQYDNNVTAYAQWTPNEYSVTYDANGGRIIDGSNTNLSTYTVGVIYDSLYEELPKVERSGYEFLGWFDAENGGNKIDENSLVKIADDHTIYAQWKLLSVPDSPCFIYSEENGEKKWIQITPYYYNGSNWEQVIPFYYDGTNWQQL